MNPTWSYSRIKAFETCPRQFYYTKVAKAYTEPETEAQRYGTDFHAAAEHYISDGTPLPAKFSYATGVLDQLAAYPGDKYCEYEMGLKRDFSPCAIDDPDVWWKGIADLLIINGNEARVVDYKTGKSAERADRGQLEMMALAVWRHFPQVNKVRAGLLFVVCNAFITDSYTTDNTSQLWVKWLEKYAALESAHKTNVWNPKPSGLCKRHCVVLECEHNGRN